MHNEKTYQVALSLVPGVGEILIRKLLTHFSTAEEIFKSPKAKLTSVSGIGTVNAQNIVNFRDFDQAERIVENSNKHGIEVLFVTDKNYPSRLKNESDAPVVLYKKGKLNLDHSKCIAIVGTRNCTSYGKEFLDRFVEQLIPHNPLIVSGLAYGIDIHAHRLALKHGISTVAVLANSLDSVYPQDHRATLNEMVNKGAVVSENPVYTKAEAYMFPSRNRIIAALSDAVVIVEAAEKGGALITAEIANDYSRDVFALPGDIKRKYSKGCNKLIKQNKAHLIESVDDLESIMRWEAGKRTVNNYAYTNLEHLELSKEEMSIVNTIRTAATYDMQIDDLSWKSQIPLNKLATSLLSLELKGVIKAIPGKKYKIVV